MDKEIKDIIKTGDVKLKNLWLKVYDEESGEEGWINVDEIIEDFLKEVDKEKGGKNGN